MQKASKELIKDKMCLKEDPRRSGWSRRFDLPCQGMGSRRHGGLERREWGWTASPGPAPPVASPPGSRRIPCGAVRRLRCSLRMEKDG